jgi:hypothetical protein
MEQLREDPEFKSMFDDIASSGSSGMDRYWNDADLMTRISKKMAAMGISPTPRPVSQPARQSSAPSKSLPVTAPHLREHTWTVLSAPTPVVSPSMVSFFLSLLLACIAVIKAVRERAKWVYDQIVFDTGHVFMERSTIDGTDCVLAH